MGCDGCGEQVTRLAHGVVGLAKSKLGIGYAPGEVIEQRRVICRVCEHAIPCRHKPEKFCWCAECGCRLVDKTRLADEACPLNHWPAVDASSRPHESVTHTPAGQPAGTTTG